MCFLLAARFSHRCEIFTNGVPNILQCLFFSLAFGPTAWKARDGYADALISTIKNNGIFHAQLPLLEKLPYYFSQASVTVKGLGCSLHSLRRAQ